MQMFGMTKISSDVIFDTSIDARSMPCESIIDKNHNNRRKIACKRKLTYDTSPNESPSCSQSTPNYNSTEENSQKSASHEQQVEASQLDCQSSINKRSSQTLHHQLRLLKLGNICQSSRKSRHPVVVLDPITMKHKIRVIDYSSWKWQPEIPLNKLTDDELKNVDCSVLQTNQSVHSRNEVIKFDRDEELIREMSPNTATEKFQKQLDEIKKLHGEPTQPKMNSSTYKSAKKTKKQPRPEIEDLDKRFQAMKRRKGEKVARKLYNHDGMFDKISTQNENIESTKLHSKKDCVLLNNQRLNRKMPMRLAKDPNFSYAY